MRVFFLSIMLCWCVLASATDYYIKNGGNDLSDGLSDATAWATLAKVNASFGTLKPGDRVLFRRDNTFYGSLIISKSGTSGSPITIGAYGTGAAPTITGFTTLSSWTEEGNGLYSSYLASDVLTNMVSVNNIHVGMGRYPDTGTNLVFESHSGITSITDYELGTAADWTGAEAVINVNDWSLDRCYISNHTGNTLTYKNLGAAEEPENNRYYFIQNHINTLNVTNEWYHDVSSGKFYIYGSPVTKSVRVATIEYLIYNNGFDYITIEDLDLRGAIVFGVYMTQGSINCIIRNCTIDFIGESGIRCDGGSYHTYDNNVISNINRGGIYVNTSGYFTITNNTIRNIGVIPGGSYRGTQNDGMYLYGLSNSTVQFNEIDFTAYNGIYITGNNTVIKNNFINYPCMVLNDGGGIYTSGNSFVGRVFSDNIILNSGIGNQNATLAEGIYLDTYSAHVTVSGNTTANCLFAGIKNHRAFDNTISNNTSYNNGAGIFLQNSTTSSNAVYNVNIYSNIIVAKKVDQYALLYYTNIDDIPGFGTANFNYYARPVDDNNVFGISSLSVKSNLTLEGWQTLSKQDPNSLRSPVQLTDTADIDFYYNPSKSDKAFQLSKPMIDVTGRKYSGIITLSPYTSVILFPDPDPTQPAIPAFTSAVIENSAPSLLIINYNLSLASVVSASSSFIVKVNGINIIVNSVTVAGNKVSLSLASPVKYGDIITISYIKPATNPLQTLSGGQAESTSEQTVKNNCISPLNKQPVVSISSPVKGSTYTAPATLNIDVEASDPDGQIVKVELFNGTEKIGEKTTIPYSFVLKDLDAGSYKIHAVATDNLKSSATSATLELNVTSIIENQNFFSLYPNPNDGRFSINFINELIQDQFIVKIVDMIGNTVYQESLSSEEELKQFDFSYLRSGIYILLISVDKIILSHKFIKK